MLLAALLDKLRTALYAWRGKGQEMLELLLNESGQGMVEYALILLIIAIALVTGLGWITGGLTDIFSRISSDLSNAVA